MHHHERGQNEDSDLFETIHMAINGREDGGRKRMSRVHRSIGDAVTDQVCAVNAIPITKPPTWLNLSSAVTPRTANTKRNVNTSSFTKAQV